MQHRIAPGIDRHGSDDGLHLRVGNAGDPRIVRGETEVGNRIIARARRGEDERV